MVAWAGCADDGGLGMVHDLRHAQYGRGRRDIDRPARVGHDLDRRRVLARPVGRVERREHGADVGVRVVGVHHLDYPLLRGFGASVLYGAFADVLFLFAIGIGLLFLVLGDERSRLASRTAELEQLTRLLLRAQEDERRRIARELHDEAGQVLTAVKIELDLDGHLEAGARVGHALAQVRDLSNLLRPSALDDLGLMAALRALADDVAQRSRLRIDLDLSCPEPISAELEVLIYRVMQEALTNAVRHARATTVRASLTARDRHIIVAIEDDGRGLAPDAAPNLGWLGMQERVTAAGGTLSVDSPGARGVRVTASIPVGADS